MGQISKGLSDKFQKLRNRAARILTFSGYETRSRVLLDERDWERLENIRHKQLAMMMYKIYNNLSPSYLRQFLPTPQMYTHTILETLR